MISISTISSFVKNSVHLERDGFQPELRSLLRQRYRERELSGDRQNESDLN